MCHDRCSVSEGDEDCQTHLHLQSRSLWSPLHSLHTLHCHRLSHQVLDSPHQCQPLQVSTILSLIHVTLKSNPQICENISLCRCLHVLSHQHGHRSWQIQSHRHISVSAGHSWFDIIISMKETLFSKLMKSIESTRTANFIFTSGESNGSLPSHPSNCHYIKSSRLSYCLQEQAALYEGFLGT